MIHLVRFNVTGLVADILGQKLLPIARKPQQRRHTTVTSTGARNTLTAAYL